MFTLIKSRNLKFNHKIKKKLLEEHSNTVKKEMIDIVSIYLLCLKFKRNVY